MLIFNSESLLSNFGVGIQMLNVTLKIECLHTISECKSSKIEYLYWKLSVHIERLSVYVYLIIERSNSKSIKTEHLKVHF